MTCLTRLAPLAWTLLCLSACASAPTTNALPDGAAPDVALPDAAPDAAPLDVAVPDDTPAVDVVQPGDDGKGVRGGPCATPFDCERDLAGRVCITSSSHPEGQCVECAPGMLCPDGVTVCNNRGSCNNRCASDADCADSELGPRCDTASGACASCLTRADCPGTLRYCNRAANRCDVGCGGDADCAGQSSFGRPTERCDNAPAAPSCVQCVTDAHCAAGQRCAANRCVAGCTATSVCPTGTTCCGGGCVDTRTSLSNCGACGRACPAPTGSSATCVAGVCGIGACLAGRADCDRDATNGCEADTATGVSSCGACGTVCPTRANATATCAAGACGFTCAAGFADCDMNPANGCEVDTRTSATSCGRCGNACPGALTCSAGACSLVCVGGLTGCGMTCVDTQTSAAHCGGCGRACLRGQSCVAGACTGVPLCDAPLTGCGLACVNPQTDTANCGGCGNACPARANATVSCATGACALTCAANFADCDMNPVTGCETDTRTSAANCGACGRACVAEHGTARCAASVCSVASCDAGYTLVSGACALTNPCTVMNGGCDTNATCASTTPGMRTCTCNSGYTGTGLMCAPESTCSPACAAGQACVNRVCVGNGPLRISMTWDRAGDMDLHVIPAGAAEIYYNRRNSNGGTLDRDDTTGTGPENVYWTAAPPAGTYLVCVVPYRIGASTNFEVTVNRPGVPAIRYTGNRSASTGNQACSATSPYLVGMFTL